MSCCSNLDHCDGRSDGHCNGHEAKKGIKHPCHNFDCNMKYLSDEECDDECQSCIERCESCQNENTNGKVVKPKKSIMQKIR